MYVVARWQYQLNGKRKWGDCDVGLSKWLEKLNENEATDVAPNIFNGAEQWRYNTKLRLQVREEFNRDSKEWIPMKTRKLRRIFIEYS